MRWVVEKLRLNLKSRAYFRKAFLTEMGGMIVNDIFWIFAIVLMFSHAGNIGMSTLEYLAAFGLSTLAFGLVTSVFGGLFEAYSIISEGEIEKLIIQPRNLLLNLALEGLRVDALGDILVGVFLIVFTGHRELFLIAPVAFLLMFAFLLFSASLNFFIEDPTGRIERTLLFSMLSFAMWPSFLLPFPFKAVPYFILPGFWLSFGALNATKSTAALAEMLCVTLAWLTIALLTWKAGIKRYEAKTSVGM